ncbi:MAG TPA: hypothetical protein VH540_10750 [Ktedonobacterales bacterium]
MPYTYLFVALFQQQYSFLFSIAQSDNSPERPGCKTRTSWEPISPGAFEDVDRKEEALHGGFTETSKRIVAQLLQYSTHLQRHQASKVPVASSPSHLEIALSQTVAHRAFFLLSSFTLLLLPFFFHSVSWYRDGEGIFLLETSL